MKTLKLIRVDSTHKGTYGVLTEQNYGPFAVTCERPWVGNAPDISCIPHGRYQVKRVKKPKHGLCWEIQAVPGRLAILFHLGNTIRDVRGCIAVGEEFGRTQTTTGMTAPCIIGSKRGLAEFEALLKGEVEFTLDIVNGY